VDPGPISIILLSLVYFTLTFYFTRIVYCFPLDTLIPFVSSKPVRLTTSSQVRNKVLGCVCAGSALLLAEDESTSIVKRRPCWSAIKPVRITFSRIVCSSPDRLNLGFLLREKTCCCAHHTFRLEFPNCLAIIIINYTPDIN
jgi:hypothetical protein